MASPETIFPDANPESTTVDGYINRQSAGASLAALRVTGTGETFGPSASFGSLILTAGGTTDEWTEMGAAFLLFDLDPGTLIPSNAVITGVSLRVTPTAAPAAGFDTQVYVVEGTPDSDTDITTGDYDASQFGSTDFLETAVTISDFTASVQETMPFNSSGIAFVQSALAGDGIVRLGMGLPSFLFGTNPGWSDSVSDELEIGFADNATAANRPALIVTYVTAAVVDEALNLTETNLGLPAVLAVINQMLDLLETVVDPVPTLEQVIDEALNLTETVYQNFLQVVDETLNLAETVVGNAFLVAARIIWTRIRKTRIIETFIRRD